MPDLWFDSLFGDLLHEKYFMDLSQQSFECYNARQGEHVGESHHASVAPPENGRASAVSDNDIII